MPSSSVGAAHAHEAMRLLGWTGITVGPVTFSGVRFWTSVTVDWDEHQRRLGEGNGAVCDRRELGRLLQAGPDDRRIRPAVVIRGCLVVDRDAATALQDASMLAGYSPRAVLIPELVVLVDAAVLDQGVVVTSASGLQRLALPGPRVSGQGFDAREWELLETVYDAWLSISVRPAPVVVGSS